MLAASITSHCVCVCVCVCVCLCQFNHCFGIHVFMHGRKRAWELAAAGNVENTDYFLLVSPIGIFFLLTLLLACQVVPVHTFCGANHGLDFA